MLDFIRLAQRFHIPYLQTGHHHCHDGWVQLHCPRCAGGHSGWHLGFSLERGNFNCWRCGSVPFREVLSALLPGRSPTEVGHIVSELQTGVQRATREPQTRRRRVKPPKNCGPLRRTHLQYLAQRGFNGHTLAQSYSVQGTAEASGLWSWRIVFPIHNEAGHIVAYQGRAIGIVKPKYRMTNEEDCLEDPRTFLYGIDKAKGDSVIIVEGATGVWRLGPGSVGTLGIDWKRQQANRLRHFKNRFILFDPEPIAQIQALRLANHLSQFPGNTEVITGYRSDPGDFTDVRAAKIRKKLGLPTL